MERVEQNPGWMYFTLLFPVVKNSFMLKYSTPFGFLDSSLINHIIWLRRYWNLWLKNFAIGINLSYYIIFMHLFCQLEVDLWAKQTHLICVYLKQYHPKRTAFSTWGPRVASAPLLRQKEGGWKAHMLKNIKYLCLTWVLLFPPRCSYHDSPEFGGHLF